MNAWRRLLRALGPAAEDLQLRPPATETELVSTEVMLGGRLPADYRAWLAITNGQEADGLSFLPRGGWLISADRLLDQWTQERRFDLDTEGYTETPDDPDDKVRGFIYHPKRITIGGWHFLDGDNTVLDLIPGPAGTVGQITTLVSECDYAVIGASFGDLLERTAALVEAGALTPQMIGEALRLAPPSSDSWEHLLE